MSHTNVNNMEEIYRIGIDVGGGSILVADKLEGVAWIVRPEHYDAANAIGAALGEVSGRQSGFIP
ncbi:hypothetical protein [Paenibacillus sp.]|uniref:hypothetical protein n=1 Tax=Paenibacillus sp. TaxID=58172 RepID=UPI0028A7AF91|nr:hypothetical protein [Paenibacillus sp.]